MSPHGYAEIDHPADLALKVWGEDPYAVLHQAARGMTVLMGVRFDSGSPIEESFAIPNGTQEEVLVDFLGEVLFLLEDKGIVLSSFTITGNDPLTIRGTFYPLVSVERWIKAVTFHNLVFIEYPDKIETTITFDV
jgi:SHS2 domain-containing protein